MRNPLNLHVGWVERKGNPTDEELACRWISFLNPTLRYAQGQALLFTQPLRACVRNPLNAPVGWVERKGNEGETQQVKSWYFVGFRASTQPTFHTSSLPGEFGYPSTSYQADTTIRRLAYADWSTPRLQRPVN